MSPHCHSSLTTEREGSWFPALPLPGLRAAVQRANRDGIEPGSGAARHRIPDRFLAASLIRSRISSAEREAMWRIAVLDDNTPQSQRRRRSASMGSRRHGSRRPDGPKQKNTAEAGRLRGVAINGRRLFSRFPWPPRLTAAMEPDA